MPNQKLLETIQCFSQKEKKQLKRFVDSPYHNTKYNSAKISQLLAIILSVKNFNNSSKLQKEKLNNSFFPQSAYKVSGKNPIDSLASDLFSLVQEFILDQENKRKNNKGEELLAMVKFYRQNNMENRFWKTVQLFRKYQEKINIIDPSYYYQRFRLEEEVAFFKSTVNTNTDDTNLVAVHTALDSYYVMLKLEYSSALQFQKILGQIEVTDESFLFGNFILKEYENNSRIKSPLATLNYQIIQLINLDTTQRDALLDNFLKTASNFKAVIPKEKYRNIMAFYRYFIAKQFQLSYTGKELLLKLLVIYKEHLEEGYFHVYQGTSQNEKLLLSSLKLITNISLRAGDIEWTKHVLETYTPSKITGTRYPEEAHSLCMAELFFYEKKYDKAHDYLEYRNFEAVYYSILADVLLLKIYYVQNNPLLENRLSALTQKIRRCKLTPQSKKKYLNFCRMLSRIAKYQSKNDESKKNSITENIKTLNPLIERGWLLSIL